jgi:hypothetical protein
MRSRRCGGGEAVGETQNRPFQLSFNSALRVEFQGARVTSDGGLILVRELDERLGLSELMDNHLSDSRRGKNNCRRSAKGNWISAHSLRISRLKHVVLAGTSHQIGRCPRAATFFIARRK